MTDLAAILAASLLSQGVPAAVSATVRLDASATGQGVLTIGHDRGGRRAVVAETLVPSLADAVELLADRDRLAGFLAQGLRAIPAASRPEIPAWIADSTLAARSDAMRARASATARRAADAARTRALPWAA